MSKSDTILENLDLSQAYSPPRKPKWGRDTKINGFDTETAHGDVFALSYSFHNGDNGVVKDKKCLTSNDIFDILTHGKARSANNMWYNLDFDANSVLKHILDKEQMAILSVCGKVTTDKYEITYIPSKFMKIKDNNGNIYTHYDASQFFYTSLENASQEWLDTGKLNEDIDVTKFGKVGNKVNNYIQANWFDIIEYARKDAILVRKLWQEAVELGESLHIPMGKPFSTGYLAQCYLENRLAEKPGLGPRRMQKHAWQSYAGGRFEIFRRGSVGTVVIPDINSAYPYVLSNLPDPKTLNWLHLDTAIMDTIRQGDYGFIDVTVTTDRNRTIQPFGVKIDGKLTYPALENERITVLKEIFLHALDNGYIENYKIHNVQIGNETKGTQYPFDFISGLYDSRKEYEKEGRTKTALLLKIILNSMYGKTCQTTPQREKVEGQTIVEDNEDYISGLSLPKMLRNGYPDGFIEHLKAGGWFNPFIASYITGMTRLELHKSILEHGLENDTIMLATDSIMVKKDPFESSNFEESKVQAGLGNWDIECKGRAFVVGAGIYEIDCSNYDYCDKDIKTKTRGFSESDLDMSLRKAAERTQDTIEIESLRPKTIAEVIWQNGNIEDISAFCEETKNISPNMDTKRKWPTETSFTSLTRIQQRSKPIVKT